MKFSIIIITYNRQNELMNCLDSIRASNIDNFFKDQYEVIVIFNGDRTYLDKFTKKFENFKIQFIHKTTPSNARNHALLKARGEFFFFLDDDCTLPVDYFSRLNLNYSWDVLGGPDRTPLRSSLFQRAVGRALTSPLCMGPTSKRHNCGEVYSHNSDEKELILCNLWIRASLFKKEGYQFNPELFRNEENFLLKELKIAQKTMHYSQTLFVYHQRKNDLEKLGLSIIKSGECRVQNFSMIPLYKELIYFLPLIWFLFLILSIFRPESSLIYFYATYSFIVVIFYAFKYKSLSFFNLFLHFFILSTYSIGLIKGLYKSLPIFYAKLRLNKSFINESKSK